MVCIPDPRQCTQDRDGYCDGCKNAHDQDHLVVDAVISEDQGHLEDQPHETRGRASGVNPPKML